MKRPIAAALLALAAAGLAHAADPRPSRVDLDKPGALAALERENPRHHQRVVEALSRAKPAGAVKRLTVPVEGVVYRVSLRPAMAEAAPEKSRWGCAD